MNALNVNVMTIIAIQIMALPTTGEMTVISSSAMTTILKIRGGTIGKGMISAEMIGIEEIKEEMIGAAGTNELRIGIEETSGETIGTEVTNEVVTRKIRETPRTDITGPIIKMTETVNVMTGTWMMIDLREEIAINYCYTRREGW